jgi:dephospho-CoA kinase
MLLNLSPVDEDILRKARRVVIIGMPCSGKTFVADFLQAEVLVDHALYHTDDYKDYGYEKSLYVLMDELIAEPSGKQIIEGVQGYRLLRKMYQEYGIMSPPDVVIVVEADPLVRMKRYEARGKGNLPDSFDKNLTTVFRGFMDLLQKSPTKPHFITIRT